METPRFFVTEPKEKPFGVETLGIYDQNIGDILIYCREEDAGWITLALERNYKSPID